MTQKKKLKATLLFDLALIALGGWLLHLRIHHPGAAGPNVIPFTSGLISLVIVVGLLINHGTVIYGYILNGMLVIFGTITMAHFSWAKMPRPATLTTLLLMTLLADIMLLWGKFGVGKAVFELETADFTQELERKPNVWRVPNMGWWLVHLAAMTLVYSLGHILWR